MQEQEALALAVQLMRCVLPSFALAIDFVEKICDGGTSATVW